MLPSGKKDMVFVVFVEPVPEKAADQVIIQFIGIVTIVCITLIALPDILNY